MRIGEFSDSFIPVFDGVGRVVKAYSETMGKMGHEVYVVAPMDNTGYRGNLPYEIVDYFALSLTKKLPYKVGISDFDQSFVERMKMLNLDICHVHSPAVSGLIGQHYAKKHNIPLVGTFHSKFYDDILLTTKSRSIATFGAHAVASFFEQCDEVWAVSPGSGETLKSYGYQGKIVVMPNGTERRILNKDLVPQVMEMYHLNYDSPILLFVGQINWKKNLRRVIESCALLKKDGKDFQLVFAGRGPDEDAIKNLIKELDLEDRFVFAGHIQNSQILDVLYSVATLFMFPSIYDNAPMVLREAANMHTAGLVIEGSWAGEVVKNMENGLSAKDTTEDVFRVAKEFLELNQEQKDVIRNNAYNTIPVSWEGPLIESVLERYQNLVDKYKALNSKFN